MAIFTFILIFIYILHDLYINILSIFIDSQILKLVIISLVAIFLFSIITIVPLFFKNPHQSFIHFTYIFLCIIVSIFCFLVLKDIISIFKKDNNFLLGSFTFIICLFIFCIYGYFNNKITITRYNLTTKKDVDMKLIFVSDLHIGNKGINEKQMKKIVSLINEENPDLLLFGGDLVENENVFDKTKNYTKILQKIKTKNIYGVLGNHEFYFNNNVNNIIKLINDNYKINILQDEVVKIDNLILIGRTDLSAKKSNLMKRKNLNEILNNVDYKDENYLLILDHSPVEFINSANHNIDLQLSGHTHGGQFFPFSLINGLFYKKNNYGIQKNKNSELIVSSGVGTSGIPLRVLTKKEVVIITVKQEK